MKAKVKKKGYKEKIGSSYKVTFCNVSVLLDIDFF